ncbi:MAG TPA: aminotransferase class III-fold pyridoxal phosphate-dependent enzyme [Terrimicrobiaceae bacterium]
MADSFVLDLQEQDRNFQLHPFTNHASLHASGTHVIFEGHGCHFVDESGRRIIDGLAGLWCVNLGYSAKAIVRAVTEQLERLPYYPSFFDSTTEPPIRVAKFLAEKAPARVNRTIFSNSGSEANETALKVIRSYWKLKGCRNKKKILSRTFSYHGVTLAATSMTGLPNCQQPFDLPLADFLFVPGPYSYGAKTELSPEAYAAWCVEETRRKIEEEGADTIAALFAEPIQGAGGVIVPPAGYLAALRQLCRENDILFVADEVITAFGRLGDWFASNLWSLDPDLICLAKGLTSGYLPLGATMLCDEVAEAMLSGGYFAHGFTYSGHPACGAAALANLHEIEIRGLISRVKDDLASYFQAKLGEIGSHRAVAEVRGYGLIGALELVPREGRDALTPTSMLGLKAWSLIREEGAMVRGIRDLIALAPPLVISHAEIDELFDCIRRGLDRLWD